MLYSSESRTTLAPVVSAPWTPAVPKQPLLWHVHQGPRGPGGGKGEDRIQGLPNDMQIIDICVST